MDALPLVEEQRSVLVPQAVERDARQASLPDKLRERARDGPCVPWPAVRAREHETVVVPGDGSKYTITFGSNGRVTTRVDCNRGSSTWRQSGPNGLQFGSWNMTRAKCGPGSLHDQIVREGAAVRTFSIKNGHLFLSGMSAGGYYELEPLTTQPRRR